MRKQEPLTRLNSDGQEGPENIMFLSCITIVCYLLVCSSFIENCLTVLVSVYACFCLDDNICLGGSLLVDCGFQVVGVDLGFALPLAMKLPTRSSWPLHLSVVHKQAIIDPSLSSVISLF